LPFNKLNGVSSGVRAGQRVSRWKAC